MKNIDFDNNGSINYTEFLSGTLDRNILFKEENLQSLFKFLDSDHVGFITRESLVRTFHRANKYYSLEDVTKMFEEIGLDPNKDKIDFSRFKSILSPINEVTPL